MAITTRISVQNDGGDLVLWSYGGPAYELGRMVLCHYWASRLFETADLQPRMTLVLTNQRPRDMTGVAEVRYSTVPHAASRFARVSVPGICREERATVALSGLLLAFGSEGMVWAWLEEGWDE